MSKENTADIIIPFDGLPPIVRKALFSGGIRLPQPFLKGMEPSIAAICEEAHANGLDEEQAISDLRSEFYYAATGLESIEHFSPQYFPEGKIPHPVYEVLGIATDLKGDLENAPHLSEEAQALLIKVMALYRDPYPRETAYASNNTRFSFLALSLLMVDHLSKELVYGHENFKSPVYKSFRDNVLRKLRMIDPYGTELEKRLIEAIKNLEFHEINAGSNITRLFDYLRKQQPDFIKDANAWPKLFKKMGVPATDLTVQAANYHVMGLVREYAITEYEAVLRAFDETFPAIRMYQRHYGPMEEDFLVYTLIEDSLDNTDENKQRCAEAFPTFAEEFENWTDIRDNNSGPDGAVSESMKADLIRLVRWRTCKNIALLDTMDALLNQDPQTTLLFQEQVEYIKQALLQMRGCYYPTDHVGDMYRKKLGDCFVKMHGHLKKTGDSPNFSFSSEPA